MYIHKCMFILIPVQKFKDVYMILYIYMCRCVCMYGNLCMYVCMYVCIHCSSTAPGWCLSQKACIGLRELPERGRWVHSKVLGVQMDIG